MKKLFLMAAVAMMATVNANAQFAEGTWSIQPMIGGGISTVTNADKINKDAEMTGAALLGVELEYQLAEKFSLAAGLNYTQQGFGIKDQMFMNYDARDIRYELSYVKIPVVANYYLNEHWAVKAGVQVGFLVSANQKFQVKDGKVKADYTVDYKDDCEKVDFSIPFGVSYQFNKPWVIDARYQLGLSNIVKNSGSETFKNSVFMITVGYKFAL